MSLPNIYQNNNEIFSNNQLECTVNEETIQNKVNIKRKINDLLIFNNTTIKIPVEITYTNKNKINTIIIGKTNRYLITLDNELILITDILDINKK